MLCTWKGCSVEGEHREVGLDGMEWAFLCPLHYSEINAQWDYAAPDVSARRLVRNWVLAGHGHSSRGRVRREVADGAMRLVQAMRPERAGN